jgi:hypothetical protein
VLLEQVERWDGLAYRSKHELIFVYRVGAAPHLNMVELGKHGRNRTNVWDYASVNSFVGSRREDLALHPTVKPTALVSDSLQDVTKRGDLVLDIFLGSGTTLIASERSGRRFRGVDIDPAYIDVAIERWETITGQDMARRSGWEGGDNQDEKGLSWLDRIAVFDCRWQELCLRLIVVARQLFDALDCRGGRRTSCF